MSAHRIALSLLPLCAAMALSACATSMPPDSTPRGGGTVGTTPAPATGGDAQMARAETRRLTPDELSNTGGWTLRTASGADGARVAALFPEGHEAVLTFDRERVSAHAGCNRISGSYRSTRDSLTLDLSVMTKMRCPDPLNQADAALSERLTGRFRAELLEGMPVRLRLTAEDGSVYVFEARPLQLSDLHSVRPHTLKRSDEPRRSNDVRANVFLKGGF